VNKMLECETGKGFANKYLELWFFFKDDFPSFGITFESQYLNIEIDFPPMKYLLNWATVFDMSLCINHDKWTKEYGLSLNLKVLDLGLFIKLQNKNLDLPSWMYKEALENKHV